jgi:hypothetical protein
MKYILPVILLLSFCSCTQTETDSQINPKDVAKIVKSPVLIDDYLITDSSFGKINKATTFNELQTTFRKENLQDTINYGAEGMDSFVVTKVYGNTPKEIVINWQMDKFHNAIGTVDCLQENSPYHTIDSLNIGSTLEKLLQVNGKKINFYGTQWDYGGMITSYNGGKFDKVNIFFRLNSHPDASDKIMGDHELNTDLPLVKANLKKLYISKISLSLHNSR